MTKNVIVLWNVCFYQMIDYDCFRLEMTDLSKLKKEPNDICINQNFNSIILFYMKCP